jgi:hypothetical protein
MRVVGLDHVQLAMPPGGEAEARRFYSEVLAFRSAAHRTEPPRVSRERQSGGEQELRKREKEQEREIRTIL